MTFVDYTCYRLLNVVPCNGWFVNQLMLCDLPEWRQRRWQRWRPRCQSVTSSTTSCRRRSPFYCRRSTAYDVPPLRRTAHKSTPASRFTIFLLFSVHYFRFLRATAHNAIARICYRPSVCLSVTRVYHRKRLNLGLWNFHHGRPIPLVFVG